MNDQQPLWQQFDAVGFDLDGVIYRGAAVVPSAPETVAALRAAGVKVGFVTNNAGRAPSAVCAHLGRLGIAAQPIDVVTSAQATASLMASQLPTDALVMCLGSAALAAEITAVGLRCLPPGPEPVDAVCFGFEPSLTWADLNEGCFAVQRGATLYACNDDLSRPDDRGIAVGTGAVLAAMTAVLPGVVPEMGGKPARPLLEETKQRLQAVTPLFVGDRLDTDIAGASNAGWASLFVFTGAHGAADLLAAPINQRPTFIAQDVSGLLQPPRQAWPEAAVWHCGAAQAWAEPGGVVRVSGPLGSGEQRLDALWAVAQAVWQQVDAGVTPDLAWIRRCCA